MLAAKFVQMQAVVRTEWAVTAGGRHHRSDQESVQTVAVLVKAIPAVTALEKDRRGHVRADVLELGQVVAEAVAIVRRHRIGAQIALQRVRIGGKIRILLILVPGKAGQLPEGFFILLGCAEKKVVLPRAGVLSKTVRLIQGEPAVERQTGRKKTGLIPDRGESRSE